MRSRRVALIRGGISASGCPYRSLRRLVGERDGPCLPNDLHPWCDARSDRSRRRRRLRHGQLASDHSGQGLYRRLGTLPFDPDADTPPPAAVGRSPARATPRSARARPHWRSSAPQRRSAVKPLAGACEAAPLSSGPTRRLAVLRAVIASEHQRSRGLRAREHADAVAATALGPVQRLIREVDQLGDRSCAGAARVHPDTDRHLDVGDVTQRRAVLNSVPDSLGEGARLFDRQVCCDNAELLATVAAHQVVGVRCRADAARPLPE